MDYREEGKPAEITDDRKPGQNHFVRHTAMKLIINYGKMPHVSQDAVREFDESILSDRNVVPVNGRRWTFVSRLLGCFYEYDIKHLKKNRMLPRMMPIRGGQPYFSTLMGAELLKCLPYFLTARRKYIYVFDAWPANYKKIEDFIDYFDITGVFFSSSQTARSFQLKYGSDRIHWIPEGVKQEDYRPVDTPGKDIDIIQFGRKYDTYHDILVKYAEKNHLTYMYEMKKGDIIFPTRREFINNLGRSGISICTPGGVASRAIRGRIHYGHALSAINGIKVSDYRDQACGNG